MLFTVIKRVICYWNPAGIMKIPEILQIHLSVFMSVSFFMFPCSKGHSVRAYLDTISMTLVLTIDKAEFW